MTTEAKPWNYRPPKRWDLFDRFIIGTPGDEYLDRLRIIVTPWFQIMLHRIYRPDRQQDMHDHPWAFLSILLWGWYEEDYSSNSTPCGITECRCHVYRLSRKVRWWNFKRSTDQHSIKMVSRRPVWTLVFTGPKRKTWGFWVDGGMRFVKWTEYEKLYGA